MTRYIECETGTVLEAELAALREAEQVHAREVYDDWRAAPSGAPDWWVRAGRPTGPPPGVHAEYQEGRGWGDHAGHTIPKRVRVLALGDGSALLEVLEERHGAGPGPPPNIVDRRPMPGGRPPGKNRAQLAPKYLARLEAAETEGPSGLSGLPEVPQGRG